MQKALNALNRHMSEGRRTPRRHQLFAFYILFGILVLIMVIAGLSTLFGGR